MMIRPAEPADLEAILEVYRQARAYMRDSGNDRQWGEHYPPAEVVEDDLRRRQLFVCEEEGAVHGVFAFVVGEEPTYRDIEGGTWESGAPYGTIHRVAADGAVKGIFGKCAAFCKRRPVNLRIDTHADNHAMRHLIEKHGFSRRGIIHVEDGSPRIAYEYIRRD